MSKRVLRPSGYGGLALETGLIYGPDGKIRQVFSTKDGPQWNDLSKWWVGRNAWASANRPAELAKSTERTQEGGLIDARLCKDYAASLAVDGKIQDAMSAAPLAIAKDATVIDWPAPGGGDLVVLRKGTNDWTCYPDWTASPGNDPECNDPVMEAWFRALMAGDKQPPTHRAGHRIHVDGWQRPQQHRPHGRCARGWR